MNLFSKTRSLSTLLAIAFVSLSLSTTNAATVTHGSLGDFLAASDAALYHETFDLPGGGTNELGALASFGPVNGYSYDMSTLDSIFQWGADFSLLASDSVGTNGPDFDITFTFTGNDVTAFGGEFYGTDQFFGQVGDSTLTIDLSDGTQVVLSAPFEGDFTGFTSDVPITSATLSPGSATGAAVYITLDNVYVGSAVVPEPSTFVLLSLAGLALVAIRKRR